MNLKILVFPHQAFRLDFDQIIMEGKRQEEIHSANKGEYAVVMGMHKCFSLNILPCILQNDWVYEAAKTFATEHVDSCLRFLRLGGQEVYRTQQELHDINGRVVEFLTQAYHKGFAPSAGIVDLAKASDFIDLIEIGRLDPEKRAEALALQKEAKEHEDLQLAVTLRAIRDSYETNIPRIMFVVRRAMKAEMGSREKESDDKLLAPPNYIDWYINNVDDGHPFYPVLGEGQKFYKIARNVGSHHIGLEWQPGTNTVMLRDRDTTLSIHVHRFQQWFRYLTHFSDLAVRGREWGPISYDLAQQYDKTFPPGWPAPIARVVIPYPD
jgi:hypothetical protein